MDLPNPLSDKASAFPESSYGATKVTIILKDGRQIPNVVLAWGKEVVKIGGVAIEDITDVGFEVGEVVDVQPQ